MAGGGGAELPEPAADDPRRPRPRRAAVPRPDLPRRPRRRADLPGVRRAGGGRVRAAGRGRPGRRRPVGGGGPQRARPGGGPVGLRPDRHRARRAQHPPGAGPVGLHAGALRRHPGPRPARVPRPPAGGGGRHPRPPRRPHPAHRRPPHGPAPALALRPLAAARRVEHLRGRVHERHDRPTQGQPGRAPLQHAQRDHLQPGAPPHVRGPVGGALPAVLHQRHARPPAPDHAGGRDVRARVVGHAGAVRDGPGRPGHHLGLRGAVVLAHAPPGARVRLAGAGRPDRRRVRRGAVPPVGPARAAPADAPDPVARHLRPLRDPLAGDDAHGRGVPPQAGLGGPAPAVHGGGGGRRGGRAARRRRGRASCGSGARW